MPGSSGSGVLGTGNSGPIGVGRPRSLSSRDDEGKRCRVEAPAGGNTPLSEALGWMAARFGRTGESVSAIHTGPLWRSRWFTAGAVPGTAKGSSTWSG